MIIRLIKLKLKELFVGYWEVKIWNVLVDILFGDYSSSWYLPFVWISDANNIPLNNDSSLYKNIQIESGYLYLIFIY